MTKGTEAIINGNNIRRRGLVRVWLSAPVIYFQFIPVAFLDVSLSVYQMICFSLYGIEKVDRRKYVRDRRAQLQYLSWSERFNCWYCSYANGVIGYAREIALRTERMWCPIKNKMRNEVVEDLPHRAGFAEYDDPESLKKYYEVKKDRP